MNAVEHRLEIRQLERPHRKAAILGWLVSVVSTFGLMGRRLAKSRDPHPPPSRSPARRQGRTTLDETTSPTSRSS